MPKDVWFDRLEETLNETRLAKYDAPLFAEAAAVGGIKIQLFGPYLDLVQNTWQFSKGLRFELAAGSPFKDLFAMTTGSMIYQPAAVAGPGKVILVRGDVPGTTLTRATGALPAWYPQPRYITYDNVDLDGARLAALEVLGRKGETARTLERVRIERKDRRFKATASQLADMWLRGEISGGLTVLGRDLVGACGASSDRTKLFSEVRMVDTLDAQTTFYNPSYLLGLWQAKGWLLEENALLPKLTDTSGPPAATGRLLFVKQSGSSPAPPFTSLSTASNTINAAIASASDGDTVLIADGQTYDEAVVIEKPISITSIGTNAATDPTPDYPILDGQEARTPITIRNVNHGIAHVSKFIITKGKSSSPRLDGGCVLIERSHNAVISSCVVSKGLATGFGPFSGGFGGGICSYHASPAIVGCVIKDNHANGRGNGIGIWGYGWPAIFDCRIQDNTPSDGAERPDGGGVGITLSTTNTENKNEFFGTKRASLSIRFNQDDLDRAQSNYVRITRCIIQGNKADDDGGGVYISVASRVIIRNTLLLENLAGTDGGGIRLSMGSELRLSDCKIIGNTANLLNKDAGGGGISSRNARLIRAERTVVGNNSVNSFAGGALYFISTDEGTIDIPIGHLDFDWNDILIDIFKYREARLEIDDSSDLRNNHAEPGSHGKGGGLYALRFKGRRKSDLGDVQGPWGPGGTVIEGAAPILINVADVQVLKSSNIAAFPNSNRLYIDDKVAGPTVKDDTSLPATGPYVYP